MFKKILKILGDDRLVFMLDSFIVLSTLLYWIVCGFPETNIAFIQVIVAALAAAVAQAGAAAITGATLSAVATTFAATFVIAAAFGALAQSLSKNKRRSTGSGSGALDTSLEPDEPRKVIYGERRVGSTVVFRHTTGNRKFYHIVMAVACHEIEEFKEVFIGEDKLILKSEGFDSNGIERFGVVGGRYDGLVRLKFHMGTDSQLADADLIADAPDKWTTNHRGLGVAYVYARLTYATEQWTNRQDFNFIIKGAKVYNADTTVTEWTDNPIWIVRDFHTNTRYGRSIPASKIDDTTAIVEAAVADQSVSINEEFFDAYPVEINSFGHVSANKPENMSYLEKATRWVASASNDQYLELVFSESKRIRKLHITSADQLFGGESAPDQWTLKASDTGSFSGEETTIDTVSGQNWVSGETKTFTFANSSTYRYYRLFFTNGASFNVTLAHIQAEETVTSEKRYTCNAVVSTSMDYKEIVDDIITTCAGRVTWSGGQYVFQVGRYRTPTLTLDEDDMLGAISIKTKRSGRDIFNTVKGLFPDKGRSFIVADFEQVSNAAYIAQDSGEVITRDIQLDNVTSNATAQRLAKQLLEQNRRPLLIGLVCKMTAFSSKVGDVIYVNDSELGWVNKEFELITWNFSYGKVGKVPYPLVRLTLQETDSAIYDWTTENNVVTRKPPTFLPDPFNNETIVENLKAASGTNELLKNPSSGDVHSRILISWNTIVDPRVSGKGNVEVFLKQLNTVTVDGKTYSPDATAIKRDDVRGNATSTFISNVIDGANYEISVRTVTDRGVRGNFVTLNHTVVGKSAPPSNVSTVHAGQNGAFVNIVWKPVVDKDLKGYAIRYAPVGGLWKDATPVQSDILATSLTTPDVKPGSWVVMVKAEDTTGNFSDNEAQVQLNVLNKNNILSELVDDDLVGGTPVGYVSHYTGVLVPDDQLNILDYDLTVSNVVDYLPFSVLTPTPVVESTYTTEELTLSFDDRVRVWGVITSEICRGHDESTNVADPEFQLAYRDLADPSFESLIPSNGISSGGTFTNCLLTYQGAVVPIRTKNISDYTTIKDIFDNTLDNPTSCTYEPVDVDIGDDKNILFGSNITETLIGTGQTSGVYQVDYRTAAGSFDGFEVWSGQRRIEARYIKQKFTWTPTQGASFIKNWTILFDPFEPWSIGEVEGGAFQGKIVNDNTRGCALITDIEFVVDLEDQVQEAKGVSIGASGTTITFPERFHSPPIVESWVTADNSYKTVNYDNTDGQTFKIKVYNDSGTGVAADVNWRATGA